MKRFLASSILVCGFLFFVSCKKNDSLGSENDTTPTNKAGVSISKKGYLVFRGSTDIVEFYKGLLNSKTKESIIAGLVDKGFKRRIENMATRSADTSNPYNLIFNEDGLLEIDNIIVKITDDDKIIYTLKREFANTENFNNLVNEVFDAIAMNKINVNRPLTSEFNFTEFVTQNPYGLEEAINNIGLRRPMFGHTSTPHTVYYNDLYHPGMCNWTTTQYITTYAFWVNTGGHWGEVTASGYGPCP